MRDLKYNYMESGLTMADFIPELLTLKEIIFEKKSFTDACFRARVNEKLSTEGSKVLKERVLGVLRHYQCLSFESLNILPQYSRGSDELLLNAITLYVLRFEKGHLPNDVSALYHDTFLRMRFIGDVRENFRIMEEASHEAFKIPEECKSAPTIYNSLLLETPEFLLKRFSSEYGGEKALKLALSLHGRVANYFLCKDNEEEKPINDDRFLNIPLSNDIILYKAVKSVTPSQAKEASLYPVSYLDVLAMSKLDIPSITPSILINGCYDGSCFLPYAFKTKPYYQSKIVPVFSDPIFYRLSMDLKKRYALDHVSPLLSESHLIKTYIGYDEFDIVVSYGKDSKVGLARKRPEILPSLNEKSFSALGKIELSELVDSSLFVKKEGVLLFICNALDKEEGVSVVKKFLASNKNFSLVSQSYVFPSESESEGGYYAIMRKEK